MDCVERMTADPDADVAMFACQVLGRIGEPRQRAARCWRRCSAPRSMCMQAAAEALGRLRLRAMRCPALVALLERDPWLQLAAVDALGDIGDPAAVRCAAGAGARQLRRRARRSRRWPGSALPRALARSADPAARSGAHRTAAGPAPRDGGIARARRAAGPTSPRSTAAAADPRSGSALGASGSSSPSSWSSGDPEHAALRADDRGLGPERRAR